MDKSKLVPSVNTSYETWMLSNVTTGPLNTSVEIDDKEEKEEPAKTTNKNSDPSSCPTIDTSDPLKTELGAPDHLSLDISSKDTPYE